MEILQVIARMNVGGTARYVGELVEKIPNSVLVTGFVQGSEIEDPCVQSVRVIRVPHLGRKISLLQDIQAWAELRKIIREEKPEIVHTHTFKAGLLGRLIRGRHKRVHTFHGHLFDDQSFSKFDKKLITFAEKHLANRTDLLVSVGKKVGVELRTAGIGKSGKWQSIAPGVKSLVKIEKNQAREQLGVTANAFLVGWMARVTEVKNPFLIVEIAKCLPSISFLIAGGGNLLEEVQSLAPKNMKVLGWADAATFWSAVDCAVSTSDNEGMPVALIEAQLAGIPVIATNVGSNAEVVENGLTGFITNRNVDEMVNAVKTLLVDSPLRKEMGAAGKQRAQLEFSLEKMISLHTLAYSELRA